MKKSVVMGCSAILAIACLLPATVKSQSGGWSGKLASCMPAFNGQYPDNITNCSFSGNGTSGSAHFYLNGSGQVILPGDTRWSYFAAGTTSYTYIDNGSCGVNCEQYTVTIAAFSGAPLYKDWTHTQPTGKVLSGGDVTQSDFPTGTYTVNAFSGRIHPVQPVSGNVELLEQ